jgi:hypothetical protein
VERIVNLSPLSEDNQKVFQRIWNWLIDNKITDKEEPQIGVDEGSYHDDGLIGIDESHENKEFPLGAVMLEEVLHYVATSDRPESSSDFSPEFLGFALRLILKGLEGRSYEDKRAFQSMIVAWLWKLIEADVSGHRS